VSIVTIDVTNALNPIIVKSPFEEVEAIQISNFGFVSVVDFVKLFGGALDMSAASLNSIDAGKMGYASYIIDWQSKGYIK